MKPASTLTSPTADTVTLICPTCGNEREVEASPAIAWVDRRCTSCAETEDNAARRRERNNLIMARLNRSNLPHNLRGKTVDPPLLDLAQRWAAGEIPVLTLHGPVGVGKTHFAAAAFRLALANHQVTWIEVARHMAMLQASFGDDDRREALQAFTGTGRAILDDIDKVVDERFGLPKLFAALDARISHGSPVLVTMNSTLDEFRVKLDKKSELGEPIVSRLRGGMVRKLDGQDRRRHH